MRVANSLFFPSLLSLTTLLAACSQDSTEAGAAAATKRTAATVAVVHKPVKPKHDMVAAVPVGKPGAPVELHFELGSRPVVGQALLITIELTPRSVIGRLQATVQGNDGIAVADGELEAVDRPQVDVALTRTVSVTPLREGVFYLSVIAYANEGPATSSRSFAIPVIVGDAGAAVAAQKPDTSVDANQARIERMPAQESSSSR